MRRPPYTATRLEFSATFSQNVEISKCLTTTGTEYVGPIHGRFLLAGAGAAGLIGPNVVMKLRSMEAGRAAFLQDEAERRDAAAAFAATAR